MGLCIPLWLLRDLKCRHCKHFLSCGPVYVTPDCGLLCGRCRALAKPNFRNFVYEELANTFRFPCLNWERHCPEEGAWNTLKEHELDCQYNGSCGLICVDPSAFFSSKRTLPNEENLLYLEVPEKCLNLVCCKNCGKYLSCEPVHINVVGSNICHRCYLSNGVPPQTLRNLAYEKLANIFRFPCIFRAKGCPIKLKFGRDSWEHEVSCHYRDIQIPSSPPTPSAETSYLHPLSGIDNSGYRPSYDGCPSSRVSHSSLVKERPHFELPRVSSLLRNQERELRMKQQRRTIDKETVSIQNEMKITTKIPQPSDVKNNNGYYVCNCGEKECNGNCSGKGRIADKEKGVVPTHTGHVYATLTQNSVLFAHPQIQPNKDPSNVIKVTKEFQDKIRRNASNASQNNSVRQKKLRNSFSSEMRESLPGTGNNEKSRSAPPTRNDSTRPFDFTGLNKHQMMDLERFNSEFSPDVKEYVQYNPQNNIQRNESLTIGNADLIAELKMRNAQKRKIRQQDESLKGIEVH